MTNLTRVHKSHTSYNFSNRLLSYNISNVRFYHSALNRYGNRFILSNRVSQICPRQIRTMSTGSGAFITTSTLILAVILPIVLFGLTSLFNSNVVVVDTNPTPLELAMNMAGSDLGSTLERVTITIEAYNSLQTIGGIQVVGHLSNPESGAASGLMIAFPEAMRNTPAVS